MQEGSKVSVKLTSRDIKDFNISKSLQGGFSMARLFIAAFFTVMSIFLIVLLLIVPPFDDLSINILLIIVAVYLFFMAILFSPILISYLANVNVYKKSPILHHLHLYTLTDEGITVSSSYGTYNLKWREINKIQGFKPCFAIFEALGKYYVIPKRCFDNDKHLNNFINIMFSKIDRSKLRFNNSKFNNFSPELEKVPAIDQNTVSEELNESEPFSEIKVLYNKKDLLRINYKIYYTRPPGIIITVIGLLFLLSFTRMLINGYIDFSVLIITLFIGLSFSSLIPFSLFINTSRQFKKSDLLKNPYIYKFYSDCFTVSHPSGSNRIPWGGLVKAIEQKSSILLYQTTQLAHIIPKSAFQDNVEQLNLLKKIISEKSPRAKISI